MSTSAASVSHPGNGGPTGGGGAVSAGMNFTLASAVQLATNPPFIAARRETIRSTPANSTKPRMKSLMATAKYGKGTVFATVDPWLYNEYTDGRKLPATFDNFGAAKELARWIIEQVPHKP